MKIPVDVRAADVSLSQLISICEKASTTALASYKKCRNGGDREGARQAWSEYSEAADTTAELQSIVDRTFGSCQTSM